MEISLLLRFSDIAALLPEPPRPSSRIGWKIADISIVKSKKGSEFDVRNEFAADGFSLLFGDEAFRTEFA